MDNEKVYSEKAKSLIGRAIEVKTETDENDNSAQRVGKLLEDMIEYASDEEQAIIEIKGDTETLKGRVGDLQEAINSGAGGGGNGSGSVKIQSLNFYKNLPHSKDAPSVPPLTSFWLNSTNVNGWIDENRNPEEGEDTWKIIVQFVNTSANAIIGPIRLRDGSRPNSTNGEDTDEIEFIYCLPESSANGYIDWRNRDNTNLESYTDPEKIVEMELDHITWYDHPQGIDRTHRYEYYSYRTFSADDGWSHFCTPMIWSRWGEDGTDGDGVEYIFYASVDGTFNEGTIVNGHGINHPDYWDVDGATAPNITGNDNKTFQDNEFIAVDSDWVDNPVDLNGEGYGPGSKQWVSVRKKQLVTRTRNAGRQDEYEETVHEWTSYSPAALWSGVGSDSVVEGYIVDFVNENMPVVVDANGRIPVEYKNQGRVQVQGEGTALTSTTWDDNNDPDSSHFMFKVESVTYSDNREYLYASDPIVPEVNGANLNVTVKTTINSFYGVNCNVKLKVKLPDGSISYLICTIYGIYIDGIENIDMYVGAPCIHVDASGRNPSPSSLPVGVKIGRNRSDTITYLSGDNSSSNGSAETQRFYFKYYFDDDNSSISSNTNGGNIDLDDGFTHSSVTVEMHYKDTSNNFIFIDRERVPYVRDGASSTGKTKVKDIIYYKAFSTTSYTHTVPTTKPSSDYAYIDGWYTNPNDTAWNETNPYLYYTHYIEYTDESFIWEPAVFHSSLEANEIVNGKDGYTIVVTPPYAILEESVTIDQNGQITSRSYNCNSWSATIQVLKGNDPQVIGYRKSISETKNCSFDVNSSTDNKTLTVTITAFTNDNAQVVTGNIGIIITKDSNDFAAVNIPIYVNRVGTRTQTIKGDVESTVFDKIIYDLRPDGSITTLEQLGTYIRTSGQNIVNLTQTITGPGGLSERVNNFEQTAGSLESSIRNMNVGTKNYFNFTYCQFMSTAIPFIQGYGLEGYGSNMQVRNLDFQTNPVAGSEEIIPIFVTCDMRMQNSSTNVKVSVCDTDPINIANDEHSVSVVTTWKSYTFVYNVQNIPGKFNIGANQNSPNGTNGHITFIPTSSNNDNRLYVRNLMVSRGNTPSSFNVSWRDYDSQTTRNQALIVADNAWNYHYRLVKQEDKYKGFDIYKFDYPDTLQSYELISATKVNTKQNKIYTLSFYAKTDYNEQENNTAEKNGNGRNAFMYGNGDAVNGTISITNGTPAVQSDIKYNIGSPSVANKKDCETNYKLNNGWQQFIIHWYNQIKPDSNGASGYSPYMRNVIAMRALDSIVQKFSVAGVELREGWWDADGINSSSLIRQTADEIALKVKDTGINIDDGTIELNADKTTINGGLNLYGGDQGLRIYDGNGGEKISVFPDNIPEISGNDYKYTFQAQIWNHLYTDPQTPVNGTLNFIESIGDVNIGDTIHISRLLVSSDDIQKYGDVGYTLKVTVGGTTIIGTQDSKYYGHGGFELTNIKQESSAKGEAIIELTLTGIPSTRNHGMQIWLDVKASSLSKIGQNGAVFATDINDFHYFGPTKTIMSHQNTQLSVEDTGIYNNGCDIGGKARVKSLVYNDVLNTNNYYASIKDTFIVIKSSVDKDINIYLPKPDSCPGKIYYMKRFNSGRTVKVSSQGTGKLMISSNSSTSDSEVTLDFDSQMFISTGSEWVHFRCN